MKRFLLIFFSLAVVGAGIYGYTRYQHVFGSTVPSSMDGKDLYIMTGTGLESLLDQLENDQLINSRKATQWVAEQMEMTDASVKPGRYVMKGGASNYELLGMIRSGKQKPIDLIIRAERTLEDIAANVGHQIEADSSSIIEAFRSNTFLDQLDIGEEDILTLIIPNTYEVYWDMNAREFRERMLNEHKRFWDSNERKEKASSLGMDPKEVYTLASIVEKETAKKEERPIIAGVYLNRLERSIPLQADPTVIYANNDYSIRRVLNRHLEVDSPYNTYKYQGLPPGPIAVASVSSIDAVLNSEDHNYLYFCARPDNSGLHQFASTLQEHNRNARRFHRWLNSRGIR